MIISRGRRYIFVHIPKTGGTAMALALEDRAMADDIMIGDTPKAKKRKGRLKGVETAGRLWKHSTLADVEGLVTRDEMSAFFVFTLVRNPWDRLVSYYHWLRAQSFDHVAVKLAQNAEFDAFLTHPHTVATFERGSYQSYMRDSAGQEYCDLYIRLEHFAQDSTALWHHLGFRLELPVANTSQRERDYRFYYTDKLADHVARICACDVQLFGYNF